MKNKKYYALGLLGILGAGILTSAPVFAAEAGGATEFTYTPGQSTGTDTGTGELADWTVDYPVKVVLTDSTVDEASGQKMTFKLLNTKENGAATDTYTGSEAVTVTLKNHKDTDSSDGIKMLKGQQAQSGVVMSITEGTAAGDSETVITTNTDTDVMTLNSTDNTLISKAFLKDNSGAEKGTNYTQTLTWSFSDGTN